MIKGRNGFDKRLEDDLVDNNFYNIFKRYPYLYSFKRILREIYLRDDYKEKVVPLIQFIVLNKLFGYDSLGKLHAYIRNSLTELPELYELSVMIEYARSRIILKSITDPSYLEEINGIKKAQKKRYPIRKYKRKSRRAQIKTKSLHYTLNSNSVKALIKTDTYPTLDDAFNSYDLKGKKRKLKYVGNKLTIKQLFVMESLGYTIKKKREIFIDNLDDLKSYNYVKNIYLKDDLDARIKFHIDQNNTYAIDQILNKEDIKDSIRKKLMNNVIKERKINQFIKIVGAYDLTEKMVKSILTRKRRMYKLNRKKGYIRRRRHRYIRNDYHYSYKNLWEIYESLNEKSKNNKDILHILQIAGERLSWWRNRKFIEEYFPKLLTIYVTPIDFSKYKNLYCLNNIIKKGNIDIIKDLIDKNVLEIPFLHRNREFVDIAVLHGNINLVKYFHSIGLKCTENIVSKSCCPWKRYDHLCNIIDMLRIMDYPFTDREIIILCKKGGTNVIKKFMNNGFTLPEKLAPYICQNKQTLKRYGKYFSSVNKKSFTLTLLTALTSNNVSYYNRQLSETATNFVIFNMIRLDTPHNKVYKRALETKQYGLVNRLIKEKYQYDAEMIINSILDPRLSVWRDAGSRLKLLYHIIDNDKITENIKNTIINNQNRIADMQTEAQYDTDLNDINGNNNTNSLNSINQIQTIKKLTNITGIDMDVDCMVNIFNNDLRKVILKNNIKHTLENNTTCETIHNYIDSIDKSDDKIIIKKLYDSDSSTIIKLYGYVNGHIKDPNHNLMLNIYLNYLVNNVDSSYRIKTIDSNIKYFIKRGAEFTPYSMDLLIRSVQYTQKNNIFDLVKQYLKKYPKVFVGSISSLNESIMYYNDNYLEDEEIEEVEKIDEREYDIETIEFDRNVLDNPDLNGQIVDNCFQRHLFNGIERDDMGFDDWNSIASITEEKDEIEQLLDDIEEKEKGNVVKVKKIEYDDTVESDNESIAILQ